MRAEPLILSDVIPARRRPRKWLQDAWQLMTFPLILFIALPVLAIFLHLTPADVLESLRAEWEATGRLDSVEAIRTAPFLPRQMPVHAAVIDIRTGALSVLERGYDAVFR